MAAGDFSASQMQDILIKQQEMWENPRSRNELIPTIQSIRAIMDNQSATFRQTMLDTGKTVGHKAIWLKHCADNTTDISSGETLTDCDITGSQIESDSLTYVPNTMFKANFSVIDDQWKDEFEYIEKVAYAMMSSKARLLNDLNAATIAFLQANVMQNRFTIADGSSAAEITAAATRYATADWDVSLMGEFELMAEFNEIPNPVILDGTNLAQVYFNATHNLRDDDKRSEMSKLAHFNNWYFDPRNVNATTGARSTFMIDPRNIGFFNEHRFKNMAPVNMNDQHNTHVWSEQIGDLTYRNGGQNVPLYVDIYRQRKCAAGVNADFRVWGDYFEVQLRCGLILGPGDCQGATGIIEIVNSDVAL